MTALLPYMHTVFYGKLLFLRRNRPAAHRHYRCHAETQHVCLNRCTIINEKDVEAMISKLTIRRYLFALVVTLTLFTLIAGVVQINEAARNAMSENAVPRLNITGDGVIKYVFDGWGLSGLRSAAGKVFPYAALVFECLLWIFFSIVSIGA